MACFVDIWIEVLMKRIQAVVFKTLYLYSVTSFNRLSCDISTIYRPTSKTKQIK